MTEHSVCAAVLRSGARCRSVTISGTDFCSPHLALVAEYGEDALRRGEYPRRRRGSALVRVVSGETSSSPETNAVIASGNGRTQPADVRPRLAEAAAANLSELERVLVETATGANRLVWATIGCKHCGREGRYEIEVPDNRVRLDAVEKLLQQGLGRAREAEESRIPRLPDSPAAVEGMSSSDMQRLADVLAAEQIAAVARNGEEALLRERIATLSDDGRQLLRDALDAARPDIDRGSVAHRLTGGGEPASL
jgi:hypothetical protein